MDTTAPLPLKKSLAFKPPSLRTLLPTVSLFSSITVFTLFFGILSNKIIALFLGAPGVGQLGIFRSLASTVSGVLALGFSTVFMQDVSVDKSQEKQNEIISASLTLALVQAVILFVLGAFLVGPLTHWLIGPSPTLEDEKSLRVVLAMAWVIIQLQNVISILRGLGDIKALVRTQVTTSIATVLCIYPLVKLGNLGLALNVGMGSAIALFLSIYFLLRKTAVSFNGNSVSRGLSYLKQASGSSLIITWQTFATTGGFLLFQSLLQKSSGLEFLGNFAAAYMILDTSTNVLMASVRGYFLPQFGELKTDEEKAALLNKMIELLLLLATLGIACLGLFSEMAITLMFSKQFETAPTLLMILSFSLLGSVFSWSYNTLMLHKKASHLFTLADTLWMGAILIAASLSYFLKWNPLWPVLFYSGASLISVFLYLFFAVKKFGKIYLPKQSFGIACQCLGLTALVQIGFFQNSLWMKIGALLAVLFLMGRRIQSARIA